MRKIIYFVIFVFCISLAYAIPPFPMQIYGDVTGDVPEGVEITFEVDGIEIGSGEIKEDKYGYDPVVLIDMDDPATSEIEGYSEGDVVEVYIEEIKVDEITLEGTDYAKSDITVPTEKVERIKAEVQRTATTTGGGSGITPREECVPEWDCSDWSDCAEGAQTRVCVDLLECGIEEGMPAETKTCVKTAEPQVAPVEIPEVTFEERSYTWAYIILIIIILGILGGAGFVLYERERAHGALHQEKQQKTLDQQSFTRLQSYAKQMLEQGYAKNQIKQELLREGWSPNVVNRVIRNG